MQTFYRNSILETGSHFSVWSYCWWSVIPSVKLNWEYCSKELKGTAELSTKPTGYDKSVYIIYLKKYIDGNCLIYKNIDFSYPVFGTEMHYRI